jgi:hypothetical protein
MGDRWHSDLVRRERRAHYGMLKDDGRPLARGVEVVGGPQFAIPAVRVYQLLVADAHPCGTSVIDPPLGSAIVLAAGSGEEIW